MSASKAQRILWNFGAVLRIFANAVSASLSKIAFAGSFPSRVRLAFTELFCRTACALRVNSLTSAAAFFAWSEFSKGLLSAIFISKFLSASASPPRIAYAGSVFEIFFETPRVSRTKTPRWETVDLKTNGTESLTFELISSSKCFASGVERLRPTRLSTSFLPLSSVVEKLALNASQPFSKTMPTPNASRTPRPTCCFSGLKPRTPKTPTSLSGAIFPAMLMQPVLAREARKSRFGFRAASRGVLPPNALQGKSPIPSNTTSSFFTLAPSTPPKKTSVFLH